MDLHFKLRADARLLIFLQQTYEQSLKSIGIEVEITAIPDELENPIPFAEDTTHAAYDAEVRSTFLAHFDES